MRYHCFEAVAPDLLFFFFSGPGLSPQKNGLIHRDLTPQNMLLADNGTLKLADFGLARFRNLYSQSLEPSARLGTPRYCSPEQFKDDRLTPASDVYAVGCILFFLFTSCDPWEELHDVSSRVCAGDRPVVPATVISARRQATPNKESVVAEYLALMADCWKQQPHERPKVTEVQRRLEDMLWNLKAPSFSL